MSRRADRAPGHALAGTGSAWRRTRTGRCTSSWLPPSGAKIDPRLPKLSGKGPRKAALLRAAQMDRALAYPAVAQKRVQVGPLLPQRFQGRVELVFVLFHEGETAPLENHWQALWRHGQTTKRH